MAWYYARGAYITHVRQGQSDLRKDTRSRSLGVRQVDPRHPKPTMVPTTQARPVASSSNGAKSNHCDDDESRGSRERRPVRWRFLDVPDDLNGFAAEVDDDREKNGCSEPKGRSSVPPRLLLEMKSRKQFV